MFKDWGFLSNPFSHSPLSADGNGTKLLIGRDKEKIKIRSNLQNSGKIITIEGYTGIGKTSLANVAVFECTKRYKINANQEFDDESPFFIFCNENFQLSRNIEIEKFRKKVLLKVAQTIISEYGHLKNTHVQFKYLKKYFVEERISSLNLGLSILGCGGNIGIEKTEIDKKLFSEELFYNNVEALLEDLYNNNSLSGVVCLIDNCELVSIQEDIKYAVENMRDILFNIKGLRWIMCGTENIFNGLINSERMEGYILDPILVEQLDVPVPGTIFGTLTFN